MSSRSRRVVSNPPPERSREPTREALLAALAERDEAIAQQAALSEVLQIVNDSQGDLVAVSDAIMDRAKRLCGADIGGLCAVDGDVVRVVSTRDAPEAFREFVSREGIFPLADMFGQTARDRPFLQIEDLSATQAYRDRHPLTVAGVEAGFRTSLGVPLREGNSIIGIINLIRREARPFSEKQIALVQAFAVQAQIAMKNARLIEETREALGRQTATSEILRVISQSPTDARPVFERIVVIAARLLRCDLAFVLLRDGDAYVHTAGATREGPMPDLAPERFPIDADANFPSRAFLTKSELHLPDWSLLDLPEHERRIRETFGVTSALYLPLLRRDQCIGVLAFAGRRANMFGPSEIAQAESFRDQALIAMENARLFDEVQARTRDLTDSLEQQTASAEILRVISSSPTDVRPVFDAIARSAVELCAADNSGVFQVKDGLVHYVGQANLSAEQQALAQQSFPAPLDRGTASGRAILSRAVVHIPDITADSEYTAASIIKAGFRSALSVPMLRNGESVGAINVTRMEARPFSDRQIELLRTFADQAVIAINNVGLFNETQEALEQQKATSEVLQVISRSTFDLDSVFRTLVENAVRLCGARTGMIFQRDGELMRLAAADGATSEFVSYVHNNPIARDRVSVTGRAALEARAIHILDVENDPEYAYGGRSLERYRSIVAVPLMRDGTPVGVFTLWRHHVEAFSPRQIALVETFADQAVVAIENVRLFNETQQALERQTATAEVLKVIASSPSDVQPVFDAIAASANRLLGGFSTTVIRFVGDALHLVAFTPTNAVADEALQAAFPRPIADFPPFLLVRDGETQHFIDTEAESGVPPVIRELARLRGYRSMLFTPLMSRDAAIGMISVTRKDPGAFVADDVKLLRTFADQAVIAIQNARMFNDTQEALEQQKASGEVLNVISQSVSDASPVFDRILDSCERLVAFENAAIFLVDRDEQVRPATARSLGGRAVVEALNAVFPQPLARTPMDRAFRERRVVIFKDVANDPDAPWTLRAAADTMGSFSVVVAPMLWEGRGIGAIHLSRAAHATFTEEESALLRTFADQAVIAIQNARMFNDTQEALEQQRASAEVLGAISKSVADTTPVFETILDALQAPVGERRNGHLRDRRRRHGAGGGVARPEGGGSPPRCNARRRQHHRADHPRAAHPPHPRSRGRAHLSPTVRDRVEPARRRLAPLRPDAVGGAWPGLYPRRPLAAEALLGPGAGAPANLRRSGRDRDRERTALQRDAGGPQAADGDQRHPPGHCFVSRRFAACARYAGGDSLPPMRGV